MIIVLVSDNPTQNPDPQEDPWSKLTEAEKKRAKRHIVILNVVMIFLVILPFIFLFFKSRS